MKTKKKWWKVNVHAEPELVLRNSIPFVQAVRERLNAENVYFARYTKDVVKIEVSIETAVTPLKMRRVFKHLAFLHFNDSVRVSVEPRDGGSIAHARQFDSAYWIWKNQLDQYFLADAVHWLHNMLGFTYLAEAASYGAYTHALLHRWAEPQHIVLKKHVFPEPVKTEVDGKK